MVLVLRFKKSSMMRIINVLTEMPFRTAMSSSFFFMYFFASGKRMPMSMGFFDIVCPPSWGDCILFSFMVSTLPCLGGGQLQVNGFKVGFDLEPAALLPQPEDGGAVVERAELNDQRASGLPAAPEFAADGCFKLGHFVLPNSWRTQGRRSPESFSA
jgi:hypothetical protein